MEQPPPAYSENNNIQINYQDPRYKDYQLVELIRTYNISSSLSKMLYILKEYDIILLIDDSGSMTTKNTLIDHRTGHTITTTRWEEAKDITMTLVDFALLLDDDGIDIFFMNREPLFKVNTKEKVVNAFQTYPSGGTPTVKTLKKIYDKYKNNSKNNLLLIITDGEPTDGGDNYCYLIDIFDAMFYNDKIRNQNLNQPHFKISMMICSDSETTQQYYSKLDSKYDDLDVNDDYLEEKKQIMRIQGHQFNFDYGDYICKILLAPICNQLDMLDEKKVNLNYIVKTFTKTYDEQGLNKAIEESKELTRTNTSNNNCVIS